VGGAIWNDGSALLDSSTVAGNGASGGGGTSSNGTGTVEVRNTILGAKDERGGFRSTGPRSSS